MVQILYSGRSTNTAFLNMSLMCTLKILLRVEGRLKSFCVTSDSLVHAMILFSVKKVDKNCHWHITDAG